MRLFMQASEWIMRLMWANILWFLFTLLGLVVLGVMPATTALFAVTRKWAMKEYDISTWKVFKDTYFSEWKNSNKIGIIFWLIGTILFVDLRYAQQADSSYAVFLYMFFVFLILFFMMTIMFFFPLYSHYKYALLDYVKQSFVYSLISFKSTIMILAGLFLISYLFGKIPGLIPFFSISLPALWITLICMRRFRQLEEKMLKIQETEAEVSSPSA